ncbi:MAG: sensor histidine kinase [Acidimicrobiales bacterium]
MPAAHLIRRRAGAVLVAAGALAEAVLVVLVNACSDRAVAWGEIAIVVGVGLVFVAAGLAAAHRRPDSRIGPMMVLTGYVWPLERLLLSNNPLLFTLGAAVYGLGIVMLGHLVLAFPTGRLTTRLERVVVVGGYLLVVANIVYGMFLDTTTLATNGCPCPRNLLLVRDSESARGVLLTVIGFVGLALVMIFVGLLIARWRHGTVVARRTMSPVLAAAGLCAVAVGATSLETAGILTLGMPWSLAEDAAVAAVPVAFLVGLARSRMTPHAVGKLVVDLGAKSGERSEIRAALAQALGDPTIAVAYWIDDTQRYVDYDGRPVELPSEGSGRAVTHLERGGRRVGALIHDPALEDEPARVRSVAMAAGLAPENERLRAEVLAQLAEVRASRVRIVEAADAERRRVERNLHDGAQQRLVTQSLALRMAGNRLDGNADPATVALLADARDELDAALRELRELARGLHPAILSEEGLVAAVLSLTDRCPVPVELETTLESRLAPAVEAGAYYVVAEAVANAAKHARASVITVRLHAGDEGLQVEVVDDGVGGADPGGSGLVGLSDRVSALDGRLRIDSSSACGTCLVAVLPCRRSS